MHFSIYQESRRGARKSNQDRVAYCYSRETLLMLVADGMGGHPHGELAARIAVHSVIEAFRREAKPRLSDPAAFLHRALAGAHQAIIRSAEDEGLPEAPRTTCVACVVQDNAACWAHAGDSRLYHLRKGAILAQTRDHSLVQQLIDSGRIREQAAAAHPQRNRVYSCLGSARPPRIDASGTVRLLAGDTLLLCTDGLWNPLSARTIAGTIAKAGILQAVPRLLDDAQRRAGRECDNLSAVAVTWERHSESAPAPARESGVEAEKRQLAGNEIERANAHSRSEMEGQTNDEVSPPRAR